MVLPGVQENYMASAVGKELRVQDASSVAELISCPIVRIINKVPVDLNVTLKLSTAKDAQVITILRTTTTAYSYNKRPLDGNKQRQC